MTLFRTLVIAAVLASGYAGRRNMPPSRFPRASFPRTPSTRAGSSRERIAPTRFMSRSSTIRRSRPAFT